MSDDILTTLDVSPAEVPNLPPKQRKALVEYLLRWGHYEAARRCLQQLLATHSHLVTVYDHAARAHLGLEEYQRALEMMRRRYRLGISISARILEARIHLTAGDVDQANAIARDLSDEHPDMLSIPMLMVDICLAESDTSGAEAAVRQMETLTPGTAATAEQMARVWLARDDKHKALLWARTARARMDRDGRAPSIRLLRLLESLYGATQQSAQAEATATLLRHREQAELEELRAGHGAAGHPPESTKHARSTQQRARRPTSAQPPQAESPGRERACATTVATPVYHFDGEIITGSLDLASEERIRLDAALRRHFPYGSFRAGQADTIAAILRGESVLAVMPTGAGKSLCYQLGATLLPGTTLVVSPLIALMKDQVDGLPPTLVEQATTLNHTLPRRELENRLQSAAKGTYKLVYAAPERLRRYTFLHTIKRASVSLLVVDEAHCVSLWGHDFRPDYHFIRKAWRELGQPPILAMTATATPRVRDDIQAALGDMRLLVTDLFRPNLRLEAKRFRRNQEKESALVSLCLSIEGSGIVYARSRKDCEKLAALLVRRGISAIHYHAGIQDRAAAQDRYMSGEARVVVATIAFGMGVDKPDVRFIIHYNLPKALENYYQEAGRAGRDGLPARCILFYTSGDKVVLTRWAHQDALKVSFLRDVYGALQNRLDGSDVGLVAVGDLERDLVADETKLRVAVHFLENARLVWRGFDLPRSASLTLVANPDGDDAEFSSFISAARLMPGQTVSRDLIDVCQTAQLDPESIEARLLGWQDMGWLQYRGTGRDMLLALPQATPESRARVSAMLADYVAGLDGRIAEMMAYADTRACRHGHISAYFGGRPIERCQSCDNCLGLGEHELGRASRSRPSQAAAPARDATRFVLQAMTELPYALGHTGLARALQGAASSSVPPARFASFGALSSWTQVSIRDLTEKMQDEGLLTQFKKGQYRLLRLTSRGQAWLDGHPKADLASQPPPPPARTTSTQSGGVGKQEEAGTYDKGLFEKLRAWRLEQARAQGKPPYTIFQDKVLRRIAAAQPRNLAELNDIKGIGPSKLESYGQEVLAIVYEHTSAENQ
jgi:ATP-dependent DNA helicase RecQ